MKCFIFVMIVACNLSSDLFGSLSSILEPVSYEKIPLATKTLAVSATIANHPVSIVPAVVHQTTKSDIKITKVSIDEVLLHVSHFLFQKFPVHGELKLSALNRWNDVSFEGSEYRVEVLNSPSTELKPSMIVNFRIVTKNGEVGKWALPVRCELYQDVYFSSQRLIRGVALSNSGLYSKLVDVLSYNIPLITTNMELGEYEVAKLLSPDRPLSWRDIAKIPNVRKGKVVDLIAEEAGMRIATKAIALENGVTSDFIKVRNLDSRKDLQAQILNENTVKVYF